MEMNAENPVFLTRDLIQFLDVKESVIHGLGVFAKCDFRTEDYIGTYWGSRAVEITPYTLNVQNEDGTLFLIEGRNLLRYINHSDTPNAVFDGIHLFARTLIRPGEEITFDYSDGEGIRFPG